MSNMIDTVTKLIVNGPICICAPEDDQADIGRFPYEPAATPSNHHQIYGDDQVATETEKCGETVAEMDVPDRKTFQRQLSEINRQLDEKQSKLRELEEELTRLRIQRKELRACMEEAKRTSKDLDAPLEENSNLLDQKASKASQLESELLFTDEAALDKRLKLVMHDYHSRTFSNAREEDRYVEEINKLKRNKKKLAPFIEILRDKRQQESTVRELRERQKKANRQFKHKQYQERNVKSCKNKILLKINGDGQVMTGIGKEVRDLEIERRNIIERYNKARNEFSAHTRSKRTAAAAAKKKQATSRQRSLKRTGSSGFGAFWNRSGSSSKSQDRTNNNNNGAASAESQQQQHQQTNDGWSSEDETLEPFYEEKKMCKDLQHWLSQLLGQMVDNTKITPETSINGPPPNTPSFADLTPTPSLSLNNDNKASSTESGDSVQLQPQRSFNENTLSAPPTTSTGLIGGLKRNKSSSSKKKKANTSVTIDAERFNWFSKLGLTPPAHYADVSGCLESVINKAKYFEELTQIKPMTSPLDWNDTDGHRMSFVYPSSESGTDSAWASFSVSEAGSLSQVSLLEDVTSPSTSNGQLLPHLFNSLSSSYPTVEIERSSLDETSSPRHSQPNARLLPNTKTLTSGSQDQQQQQQQPSQLEPHQTGGGGLPSSSAVMGSNSSLRRALAVDFSVVGGSGGRSQSEENVPNLKRDATITDRNQCGSKDEMSGGGDTERSGSGDGLKEKEKKKSSSEEEQKLIQMLQESKIGEIQHSADGHHQQRASIPNITSDEGIVGDLGTYPGSKSSSTNSGATNPAVLSIRKSLSKHDDAEGDNDDLNRPSNVTSAPDAPSSIPDDPPPESTRF